MTIHRFDLGPASGRGMLTPCRYLGAEVLRSHAPIHDAARWLLDHGHADPSDTVETWREGVRCMSGTVGHLAAWTVTEADREGLRAVPWADLQAKRSRLDGLRSEGHFPPRGAAVDGQTASEGIRCLPTTKRRPWRLPTRTSSPDCQSRPEAVAGHRSR